MGLPYWLLLSLGGGNPLFLLFVLALASGVADWYAFGTLRFLARQVWQLNRAHKLRRLVAQNPHDRRSRAELAEIRLGQHRFRAAVEIIHPAVEADPHDLQGLWLLGVGCLNSGRVREGELFLEEVIAADPSFRRASALLELGRSRVARKAPSAVESLTAYLERHPHSVEARALLSRALDQAGKPLEAAAERERCWREYTTSLPYQRRQERLWAWRVRPSRPALYATVVLAAVVLLSVAASSARPPRRSPADVRESSLVQP